MNKIEKLIAELCPDGVEFKPLEEIAHVLNGYSFKSKNYTEKGIRIIRISDVQKGRMSNKDLKFYPNDIPPISRYLLHENDLVMSLTGNVGRVAMLSITDLPAALNQRVTCVRVKSDNVLIRFLFHFFDQDIFEEEAMRSATGGGQKNLSMKWLKKHHIPVPPLEVQQKIVDCLGSLDDLIAAEGRKIEALRQHKLGLMQQLFPQPGGTMPKLRFPEFRDAGEWEPGTLGQIGKFIGGGTPSTSIPEYWGGNIQWFTPSEMNERNLSKSKRTITCEGLKHSSARLLPTGALLITTRATIGDVGIADNPCATNQGFQSLAVFGHEVNVFWYYWLVQHKRELIRHSSGSTFLEIRKTGLKQIPIVRPNKDEQQKIADCLGSLDDLIAAESRKLETLRQHKQGLMQQLFPCLETE